VTKKEHPLSLGGLIGTIPEVEEDDDEDAPELELEAAEDEGWLSLVGSIVTDPAQAAVNSRYGVRIRAERIERPPGVNVVTL
jgi:hypothetical protein